MSSQENLPVNPISPAPSGGKLKPTIHPMVAMACAAVIALSATGIAAFSGVLQNKPANAGVPAPLAANAANTAASSGAADPAAAALAPTTGQTGGKASVGSVGARPETKRLAQNSAPVDASAGVIESIRPIKHTPPTSGVGAVAGGVVGGVVGNQIGGGNGKTAMTVLGAVGGGVLGNHIEKQQKTTTSYQVSVRMDNGTRRTVSLSQLGGWQVGERVRLEQGQLVGMRKTNATG